MLPPRPGSQADPAGEIWRLIDADARALTLVDETPHTRNGGGLMPFGGNDWLALTPEPPLEPGLPICDPHHHFWDFRTARIPYRRYLLHELAADITSGHTVRSTVFVEARAMYRADGPEEMPPVGAVKRAAMFHDTAVRVSRIAV